MKPVLKLSIDNVVQTIPGSWSVAILSLFIWIFPESGLFLLAQTPPDIGVQLPENFKIQQVATDSLASNIFRIGINQRGDVFASGPGYIKRLIDKNRDGVFDDSAIFSILPEQGAQGLLCGPDHILAVGDNGVWRFEDADRDGIADGPPKLMFKIETGGEHLAHQIKLGPDGWYYLIAGNQTPIRTEFSQGEFSPVRFPRAGFLMRTSPDFKTQEVVAHGFRNAYDFAFNDRDQIFVFDSDDEREVGLPWYRPTRLFEVQPGDDAGWIHDGWKRPSYFFDMPLTIGDAGRGSPTGVLCYRGSAFAPEFRQAIFFADWTFGRIMVSKRDSKSQSYLQSTEFAKATGQFGFAITDMVEDLDGSLLVSVGGRKTSGAIYRISYAATITESDQSTAESSLLGLGRKRSEWSTEEIKIALKNRETKETLLKALIGRGEELNQQNRSDPEISGLIDLSLKFNLQDDDLPKRKLFYRLGQELDETILSRIDRTKVSKSAGLLINHLQDPIGESRPSLVEAILNQLEKAESSDEAMFLVRLAQLVCGDFSENSVPASLQGYVFNETLIVDHEVSLRFSEMVLKNIQLANARNRQELAIELGRLGAGLNLTGELLQKTFLDQISNSSIPIDDIHWLLCLSRTGSVADAEARKRVAMAVLLLDDKIKATQTLTDRNWELRIREMVSQLLGKTPELARNLADHFSGTAEEAHLITSFPPLEQELAAAKLAAVISANPEKTTPNQLVALLATKTKTHQSVFRATATIDKLFETSVLGLAQMPEEQDRTIFRRGLKSRNLNVLKNSAIALRKLKEQPDAADFVEALFAVQRLPWTKEVHSVRDQLMMLLERHGTTQADYQSKQPTLDQSAVIDQWSDLLKESFPKQFESLKPRQTNWRETFDRVDWIKGEHDRGRSLFESLKCAQCHQGNLAIGPSLEGVTQRFSRADLFQLMAEPSNRISDRYRGRIIELTDGTIHSGMVIYESVDGVTLLDTSGITRRIESRDIDSMRPAEQSLMPSGLLDSLKPEQWADLEAFLKKL